MNHDLVCNSAEFGENFRLARKRKDCSLGELAKELNDAGVRSDSSSMSRLERDQLEPGVIWAAHAALALNTTLDGLVYRRKLEVPTSRRELQDREHRSLVEIADELTALNDEYPNIDWFAVAAESVKGTRAAVAEQNRMPVASSISEPTPGEKVIDAPPSKAERTRSGDTPAKSDRLRAVSEDAADYGETKNE